MGNVINFPSRSVREWADIERTFRELLKQVPLPIEMQNDLLVRMKEFFHRFNAQFGFSFELPPTFSLEQQEVILSAFRNAIKDHEKKLHDFMNELLLDRWQLEVELYKLRHEETKT